MTVTEEKREKRIRVEKVIRKFCVFSQLCDEDCFLCAETLRIAGEGKVDKSELDVNDI